MTRSFPASLISTKNKYFSGPAPDRFRGRTSKFEQNEEFYTTVRGIVTRIRKPYGFLNRVVEERKGLRPRYMNGSLPATHACEYTGYAEKQSVQKIRKIYNFGVGLFVSPHSRRNDGVRCGKRITRFASAKPIAVKYCSTTVRGLSHGFGKSPVSLTGWWKNARACGPAI